MFSTGITFLVLNSNSAVRRCFENPHSVGTALHWKAKRRRFWWFYIMWPFPEWVQSLISSSWESPWIAVPKLGSFLLGHMHSKFTPSTEWCGNLNLNVLKWKPRLSNPLDEKKTAVTWQKDMHTFLFLWRPLKRQNQDEKNLNNIISPLLFKMREKLILCLSLIMFLKIHRER